MIDLKQVKKIKFISYDLEVKRKLLRLGYKLEYNVMYKKIHHQGIMLCLDFSSHDLGIARVEMPNTFYIEMTDWIEFNRKLVEEIKKLREVGIII